MKSPSVPQNSYWYFFPTLHQRHRPLHDKWTVRIQSYNRCILIWTESRCNTSGHRTNWGGRSSPFWLPMTCLQMLSPRGIKHEAIFFPVPRFVTVIANLLRVTQIPTAVGVCSGIDRKRFVKSPMRLTGSNIIATSRFKPSKVH